MTLERWNGESSGRPRSRTSSTRSGTRDYPWPSSFYHTCCPFYSRLLLTWLLVLVVNWHFSRTGLLLTWIITFTNKEFPVRSKVFLNPLQFICSTQERNNNIDFHMVENSSDPFFVLCLFNEWSLGDWVLPSLGTRRLHSHFEFRKVNELWLFTVTYVCLFCLTTNSFGLTTSCFHSRIKGEEGWCVWGEFLLKTFTFKFSVF